MSDSYQAIYDAVRSRISGGNISEAVDSALREAFGMASHHLACVAQDYSVAASEAQRPCVLMRPAVYVDGDQWCALYGSDLQSGVAGFGDSPALAMIDFDKNWHTKIGSAS